MVLKRVSTIIPLGNLTRRGTAKEFESKRRKLSEPGPMKNRNSWIGNTEVDGLDECKVLAQGSSMKYSMFYVIWMSFIFWGIGVFEGCIVFFLQCKYCAQICTSETIPVIFRYGGGISASARVG